jgi:predicted GNAT family acetyltransferase
LPENVEIRKVADETDVNAFYQFAEWCWNVPDEYKDHYAAIVAGFRVGKHGSRTHMWQAWSAGRPVAKAGMYQDSGSVGIYGVSTIPEARGVGLARTLTLTALHGARSSAYRLAELHSTPMAVNLYKCIGFTSIAEFRLFASEEVRV